jgi:hypothetical protein
MCDLLKLNKVENQSVTEHNDFSYRTAFALMVCLLLGAAFMRMYDLVGTPPGTSFDAAWDTADALRISRGIPFHAAFGERPEPLHRFLLAGWFKWAGASEFTARYFHVLANILTVALVYQAGLQVLHGRSWRRAGALIAVATLAAFVSHLVLSRNPYRVILLPMVITTALILLLRAQRTGSAKLWMLGGLAAAFAVHIYLAGIAALAWLGEVVFHQIALQKGHNLGWRNMLSVTVGAAIPLSAWLLLILLVPGLLFRVQVAGGTSTAPLLTRLQQGLGESVRVIFITGSARPLFDVPDTPLLNPALGLCFVAGIMYAIWRWRHADGAFVLGGFVVLMLPAVLSAIDGNHAGRMMGATPFLAVLTGSGAAWLMQALSYLGRRTLYTSQMIKVGLYVLIPTSLLLSHLAFQGMFADSEMYEPPDHWYRLPHNYTIALYETFELLMEVDQPTYVPLGVLDTALGYFVLQNEAYPNVTTWARYGLLELPAGQIFYPAYAVLHNKTSDAEYLQALFLPDEKTIVILPPADGPVIEKPSGQGVQTIKSDKYGWDLVYIAPRPVAPLPIEAHRPMPVTIGDGLQLMNQPQPFLLQPGQATSITQEWLVNSPQPADIFSVAQVIDTEANAVMRSEHHVLQYLYPSARWQPGDIIPDIHSFEVPETLPEDFYRWGIGAYVPPGQRRLPVVSAEFPLNIVDNLWLMGVGRIQVPVSARLSEDAVRVNVVFDDHIHLERYRIEASDTTWTLTLYWRTETLPLGDYVLFVHAMKAGELLAQADEQPNGGLSPTWSWWPGELVVTNTTLTLPDSGNTPDELYVGMYRYPSLERLDVVQNGETTSDNRALVWTQGE